jgi:hypothetical protein
VKLVIEAGLGTTAEACHALGLARSSYYRNHAISIAKRQVRRQIVALSQEHPRYGYRRVDGVAAPGRPRDQRQAGATDAAAGGWPWKKITEPLKTLKFWNGAPMRS